MAISSARVVDTSAPSSFFIGRPPSSPPRSSSPPAGARLDLVSGDITRELTDAIVSPTDERLGGAGLVHLAVQRVGGPELAAACRSELLRQAGGKVLPGDAIITRGFGLPARYVIHTVPPVYDANPRSAAQTLARCYGNALRLARAYSCSSIAFPAVATGVYGYPIQEAAEVALRAVRLSLLAEPSPTLVRFVLFGPSMLDVYTREARRVLAVEEE